MSFYPGAVPRVLSMVCLSAVLLNPAVSQAGDRDERVFQGQAHAVRDGGSSSRGSRGEDRSFELNRFDDTDALLGGSVSSSARRSARRGQDVVERGRSIYARRGSMLRLREDAGFSDDRSYRRGEFRYGVDRRGGEFGNDGPVGFDPGFRGFDQGDGRSSFVYYIDPAPRGPSPVSEDGGGPKIIDVEAERLDRRAIGPRGIDIVHTGGAKIIRIAPGYHMADSKRGGGADRTPVARGQRRSDGDLQPWSSGWLRYCTRTYRSFDPDLGTYVGRDAKIRFCTAE